MCPVSVNRAFVDLLLALVVAASCLLQYGGTRLLRPLPASGQNRIAIVSLAMCALALAVFRANILVTNCCVLVAALVGGTLLSRQIGSVGALATTLIVAATADVISTQVGPSRWLANQAQHPSGVLVLQFLAVSIHWNGHVVPVIGVTDLMFFTTCVIAGRRLGWPEAAALAVPLVWLMSALG